MIHRPTSDVARALKRCRVIAGLSAKSLAARLDMPETTYKHYEDRFRKAAFPPDFACAAARALYAAGVAEDELAPLFAGQVLPAREAVKMLDLGAGQAA